MEQLEKKIGLQEVMMLDNDESISFERADLLLLKEETGRAWKIQLTGVGNETVLEKSILGSVSHLHTALTSKKGEKFKGTAIVSDYDSGSNGNDITLNGTSSLVGFAK